MRLFALIRLLFASLPSTTLFLHHLRCRDLTRRQPRQLTLGSTAPLGTRLLTVSSKYEGRLDDGLFADLRRAAPLGRASEHPHCKAVACPAHVAHGLDWQGGWVASEAIRPSRYRVALVSWTNEPAPCF